jgi:hypothetical protein
MSKLPTFIDSDLAERALTLDLVVPQEEVREEDDDEEEDKKEDDEEDDEDDDEDDDEPAGSDGYSE